MAPVQLRVGIALGLALIAAVVLVHSDVDLLDGIFHLGREIGKHQDLTTVTAVVLDEPPVVVATAPLDTTPVSTGFVWTPSI